MCTLSETKLKGKGEVMFGEVMGKVSGVPGRQGEGRGGPGSECADDEVCSRMEGGVIQAYVG